MRKYYSLLMEENCDINREDHDGISPLQKAFKVGNWFFI